MIVDETKIEVIGSVKLPVLEKLSSTRKNLSGTVFRAQEAGKIYINVTSNLLHYGQT